MRNLEIDPVVPFILPPAPTVTICLVGCGGTGSHVAQALARLAVHCHATGGPRISLAFVDGDVVEPKNVGRQLFAPSDVGKNKAQVLAARFGAVFGVRIVAFPSYLAPATSIARPHEGWGVLVGAVDNVQARAALASQLGGSWRLWVDAGNHEHAGQVLVGSTGNPGRLRAALALGGACAELPSPALQRPALITPAEPIQPVESPLDCAAAVAANIQSLAINHMMAAWVEAYLYDIVIRRRLESMETVVDLNGKVAAVTPITATNLARVSGLTVAELKSQKVAA